jgi:hypothetical protein
MSNINYALIVSLSEILHAPCQRSPESIVHKMSIPFYPEVLQLGVSNPGGEKNSTNCISANLAMKLAIIHY